MQSILPQLPVVSGAQRSLTFPEDAKTPANLQWRFDRPPDVARESSTSHHADPCRFSRFTVIAPFAALALRLVQG
jgi:hypothetical protein